MLESHLGILKRKTPLYLVLCCSSFLIYIRVLIYFINEQTLLE